MNKNIKMTVAAAVVMMGMAPSAFASQQLDNKSLTDILVSKGVLTSSDVKAIKHNNDGKLKLGAKFYLNTFTKNADTTTATGTTRTKTTGLQVDRAYFTAKYHFNDDWMMRITTDMNQDTNLKGKKQNIYLKYAYVQGKLLGDAAVLRLGQSHTPWIDYEQGLWKHRYVSKTMVDQYKFDDSSDLGLGLKGKLAGGLIKYFVTETTGAGYGNGAGSTNGLDFNSRISIYPISGLTLDFQFRDGYRGSKTSVASVGVDGVKSTLFQGMATYGTHDWRVGVNYLNNRDKGNDATSLSTTHGGNVSSAFKTGTLINDKIESSGGAVWAWTKLPGTKFGGFGRYEKMNNQRTTGSVQSTKEKITRFMVGAEYFVTKGIQFSLVYDNTSLKNRGAVTADKRDDTRYGLYSRIKF